MESTDAMVYLSVVSVGGRILVKPCHFAISTKVSQIVCAASDELGSTCKILSGTRVLLPSWNLAECELEDGAILTAIAAQLRLFAAQCGRAFAAVKPDGSVITWGASCDGSDSSGVKAELAEGVVSVTGAGRAFAAIKTDGSVLTWG